eukprot:1333402-Prymnesium_polylepis.1
MYTVTAAVCSVENKSFDSNSLCQGGPHDEISGTIMFTFTDYRPAILNAIATLLLAFYANVALGHYQQ